MSCENYPGGFPFVVECDSMDELLNGAFNNELKAYYLHSELSGDFDALAKTVEQYDDDFDIPFWGTAQEVRNFFAMYNLTPEELIAVQEILHDMQWAEELIARSIIEGVQFRVLNAADRKRSPKLPWFHCDGSERLLRPYNNPATEFWMHALPKSVYDEQRDIAVEAERVRMTHAYSDAYGDFADWPEDKQYAYNAAYDEVVSIARRLNSYINNDAPYPSYTFPLGTFIRFSKQMLHRTPPQMAKDAKLRFLLVLNYKD